ncbi:DUF4192 domain-containing protein [Glycomyces algeriensis]|uniref:DUF4192 domain-containing protein n=1 Tax=Glycomyces algeriensis TaxID=256037 RepID=A0A9W6LG36_9ACTN|nr:DUF4192 domain-containing protein [Glycomyces algeriensis]MDA1367081.1 DUF4192 domain-containing protein [Glycomyces algeriensis]MDR7348532.1 hypothetical protein [Glycomyces algeriensis]GLI41236.1 hypothetical protein GALLR39Z86_10860 [Glycomyces algeriensis]
MHQTQARISLNGPTDLLTTVPLLLGFHPDHSLVIVGLIDGELQCTFRVDLPGSADHLEHLQDLTAQLSLNECNGSVVIVYGEAELAQAVAERAATRLVAAGMKPIDQLRVDGGRWFSLICGNACCPTGGLPLPETSAASCEVAVAGGYAAPDRSAIAAQLAPAPAGRRAAVARAVLAALMADAELDWVAQRDLDLQAIDHWMDAKLLPEPEAIAAVGLALGDLDIRDYALRRINSGRFEGNRVDLWLWVTRHLEDDLVAPAATVAGFAAYRFGNGVLALEAFELALRASPHYRLAQMLMAALQAGIPPGALSRIGCGDREEAEVNDGPTCPADAP